MSNTPPTFSLTDWRAQERLAHTAWWKRLLYEVAHPAIALEGRRHLSRAAWARWNPSWAYSRRGFPLEARRTFATVGTPLSQATVLVQGTGTGWDAVGWAALRPARVIAVDAWSFPTWDEISAHCWDEFGVRVTFHEAHLERCAFLPDASVDLCVSHTVLEHVQNLPEMLQESHRILKPGGHLYATFGPLWFAPGGDHFSVRGGLENVYAHIDRDPAEYQAFFAAHKQPVEDFQNGGRYVELDLFSKLTVDEYLAAFADAGFRIDDLVVEICPLARAFERRFPERIDPILARHAPRITRDDLRTKTLTLRAKRV